jgi:hypothetical protein
MIDYLLCFEFGTSRLIHDDLMRRLFIQRFAFPRCFDDARFIGIAYRITMSKAMFFLWEDVDIFMEYDQEKTAFLIERQFYWTEVNFFTF